MSLSWEYKNQQSKVLDIYGNIVATSYDSVLSNGTSKSSIVRIFEGEIMEDGILYPARTITLNHGSAIALRDFLIEITK